ncbi:MAG: adenylosuccinate lyase [Thermoprotei archaeon]|nr:MAG: adenylosuccinate lyase [Thermoprotei archaeon]RLF17139.1 MAG: adenylosuccinate lyase [Thermoprotei archaeon]
MPILPIDTGRYGSPEIRKVFDEEARLQRFLDVEAALAKAHAELGNIPAEAAEEIASKANVNYVKLERVKEIEARIKHDLMAVVEALEEVCGPHGRFVHFGATSYDIEDTATALQLKEALEIIEARMLEVVKELLRLTEEHAETVMVGRTHGQHAPPITLGFKFAVWLREMARHVERLKQVRERVLVGKMSGAVGTMAGFGPKALELQRRVMEILGLKPAEISTQIVQRDRYAELISLFALIASSLDKFATEIRNLQRPEIMEVAEGFEAEQVGSSTMPHKQNPITCERICSLAKLVRGLVVPAYENIPLWHERDLTNSASERFLIPESCILLEEMLRSTVSVLRGLRIYPDNMRKNLELTQGRILSEAVMLAMVKKGVPRKQAHEKFRRLSAKSMLEKRTLLEVALEDPEVSRLLSREELERLLNAEEYLGMSVKLARDMVELTRKELGL